MLARYITFVRKRSLVATMSLLKYIEIQIMIEKKVDYMTLNLSMFLHFKTKSQKRQTCFLAFVLHLTAMHLNLHCLHQS